MHSLGSWFSLLVCLPLFLDLPLLLSLHPLPPLMALFILLAMISLVLSPLFWTLPDASDCTLPFIYNKSLFNHTLDWSCSHFIHLPFFPFYNFP